MADAEEEEGAEEEAATATELAEEAAGGDAAASAARTAGLTVASADMLEQQREGRARSGLQGGPTNTRGESTPLTSTLTLLFSDFHFFFLYVRSE